MSGTDDLRVRPGRIRSTRAPQAKSFLSQALKAAQKAGGLGSGLRVRRMQYGRGRTASLAAARLLNARSRGAMVKARVVRQLRAPGALRAHVTYLQRDGVTRDGQPGRMFDAHGDGADAAAFTERCDGDRHHFRFIVSPDDAAELGDLRGFTRDLMRQASQDLDTSLDWVAVDHWNTEHPHIHVLLRGRTDAGEDLVINRDYISQGLRARAGALVTQELGLRTELEVRRGLEAEVSAERLTRLDRVLVRDAAAADGLVDLRLAPSGKADPLRELRLGRMRELERLGLAEPAGSARWVLSPDTEATLRELGARGDIIKRLHRSLTTAGVERATSAWSLETKPDDRPIIGRLLGRGLDDELRGSAFAVVDGVDGRVHHLSLPDLQAAGDSPVGAIVEARRYEDRAGRSRVELATRSDLDLDHQVGAVGSTWIDRQLVAREPINLARSGFGLDVRAAMERRIDHLAQEGLASRHGTKVTFKAGLVQTLRQRELIQEAERLQRETGLAYKRAEQGEPVSGRFSRRLSLASGRFAMIDNGLGFQLVPWTPTLERERGRQVNGIVGPTGVDWGIGRRRSLSV